MFIRLALALAASFLMAAPALADEVWWSVNGTHDSSMVQAVSASPPYTDVVIDLGNVVSNTDLKIYSGDGGSAVSVGTINIKGTDPSHSVAVRVAVVDEDVPFGEAFIRPIDHPFPGLKNLGGLNFTPADNGEIDLQDQTAVSINLLGGDITGEIAAGEVFHVDCLRGTAGGVISGVIRSTAADGIALGRDGRTCQSIAYVKAWKITGDIIAYEPPDTAFAYDNYSTWGSIGTVVAGPLTPDPNFVAISGKLQANKGDISAIYSTGRIGTSTTDRAIITAGLRLERLTMGVENTVTPQALPVYADIECSAQHKKCVLEHRLSSLSVIETAGDYVGDIALHDFDGESDAFGQSTQQGRKGIFVGGKFVGDINVTYGWQSGDMIARSFRGNITIRQMFRGSIVAVGYDPSEAGYNASDALDGTIQSVIVGFNSDGSDHTSAEAFPMSTAPHDYGLGFNGQQEIIAPPFEGTHRVNWYTAPNHYSGSTDSVIRADRKIGTVALKAMSNHLDDKDLATRPRVESPVIDWLRVDAFDLGSIWSGILNSDTTAVTNEIADDYASITQLNIGCVGPRADLWVKACPVVDIHGDMFGAIHLPELKANEIIRIAGRFGDVFQAEVPETSLCGADFDHGETGSPEGRFREITPVEAHSPRGYWEDLSNDPLIPRDHDSDSYLMDPIHYDKSRPRRSAILIRKQDALRGQVILDAENSSSPLRPRPRNYSQTNTESLDNAAYWLGTVEAGTGLHVNLDVPEVPTIISTLQNLATSDDYWARFAPDGSTRLYYPAHAWTVGGGAVGMVPFDLYHSDCIPQSDCMYFDGCSRGSTVIPVPVIGRDEFMDDGIVLTWYGPVELGTTSSSAQKIAMFSCDDYGVPNSLDLGSPSRLSVTVQPVAASPFTRLVRVKLLDSTLPADRYMLQRYEDTYYGIACDEITVNRPVNEFVYNFYLAEESADPGNDQNCGSSDFNCDGDFGTDQDIEAFFACLGGQCPACGNTADFNGDGDTGTDQDIEAFFRVLGGGHC